MISEIKLEQEKIIFRVTIDKDEIQSHAEDHELQKESIDMKRLSVILISHLENDMSIKEIFYDFLVEEAEKK
jgi:hypothetical protein